MTVTATTNAQTTNDKRQLTRGHRKHCSAGSKGWAMEKAK